MPVYPGELVSIIDPEADLILGQIEVTPAWRPWGPEGAECTILRGGCLLLFCGLLSLGHKEEQNNLS